MEKEYIYRTNNCYEFNTLEEALKHAELDDECSIITKYNTMSDDDYEESEQVWVRESKLNEGTSNFGRLEYLPLLVFYTYDEVLERMKYDSEYPNWDDFDTDREYYDAVEKFEQKFLDNFEYAVLDESDIDELENALYLFNLKTQEIARDLDVDEEGYQQYENNLDLEDIKLEVKSGYYEAAYIDCENERYFDNLDKEVKEEQLKRFKNFLLKIKQKYYLMQLGVTGTFSNGETIYHKVESLNEEKDDNIYYCLSDKKMPKHSIIIYGEEGRNKLLEIAPKYYEYYGQAEIFKSVNGNKTTIWEDGKLVEEEPTIKIKQDSEKVVIDKEDTSEVGEPGNPVQQGLKGVNKLENLKEAHSDYSDNLGEFTFNGTNYWVKGEKSHTRDYHWQEVWIKDTDHYYETVGYGKYKWLNRPWYRFEYDPAFKQAFLNAFGKKYDKFITDIIDSSYSVKDCCEKITKSSENLDVGLEEAKKKDRVRFVGNPEKEMAFFNHTMGSDVGVSMGESKEELLKESRDEERVAHYQKLLDKLYVTPEETELILKTADEYEENADKGWITFDEADEVTEKLNLKNLSPMDLSRMWEVVYYTLEKAAFENDGENYEKYSDAASAFAEVINMEARKRKEQIDKDSNLEAIVGDRFMIDDDGILYLTTSAMKDLVAWAKRRGKTIDDLMSLSITKSKDGRTGTLNLKDYSIQFKKLWN